MGGSHGGRRRGAVRGVRRSATLALLTVLVLVVTAAFPPGAVPAGGSFPLPGLRNLVGLMPAWASVSLGTPVQPDGGAISDTHYVGAGVTRGKGGAGSAPQTVPGALPAYQPHDASSNARTTGARPSGFDEGTSVRVNDKSSIRSDVYLNQDGTYTRRLFDHPVNYQSSDGAWHKIDPNLVAGADGRLHMAANAIKVSVAAQATDAGTGWSNPLAQVTLPSGQSIAYGLSGAQSVAAGAIGADATYPDILPDTDLELSAFDSGVKETLVLKSAQAPSSWLFPLKLTGLTPRMTASGGVELLNSAGSAVAWFPAGYMEDSKVDVKSGAPVQSGAVTFSLVEVTGGIALKVVADRGWLDDPARVYPVRVDPTSTTVDTGDVYIDTDASTTYHGGNNLPVGTYDGGGVKARSFLNFGYFDDNGFVGKHITAANLKLFHTWSYDCNHHLPIYVHRVLESWSTADLAYAPVSAFPGPSISAAIGSLSIADNYPACLNTSGVRSTGSWVSVPLGVDTFNDWSTGQPVYGLAVTASESDSYGWKRFTSDDYQSGAYQPYLQLTYSDNVVPQVDLRYPGTNTVVSTLEPELLVRGHDPDSWPGLGLSYKFSVYDATGTTAVVDSGWTTDTAWSVPSGVLEWNKTYLYTVQTYDQVDYSPVYPAYAFTTGVPQPVLTSSLALNDGKGFSPSIGNFTTSATDADIATVGPALTIARNYNSLDLRRRGAFGAGWSSVLDTSARQVSDATGSVQSVVVTYPNGVDVGFGRNADGSFTPPSGHFATLVETSSAGSVTGYTLTDKNATIYTLAQSAGSGVFKISSITDANARTETFSYDASGDLATMTSASGRALHFTWTTPASSWAAHVATVVTDPVSTSGTELTWNYGYNSYDRLTTVCPPTSTIACTNYVYDQWISQYVNAVLDAHPSSYWRLNEDSGTTAASSVLANVGVDNATYSNVTLGGLPALEDSTSTSAGFDGATSSVRLPGNLIHDGQYQSVSMWLKTTASNEVLFSYSADPITNTTTSGNYTPALYVDTNGMLRGGYWTGSGTPMSSVAPVNDGVWHHVALVGIGNTQVLYVDGVAQATKSGTIHMYASGGGDNVYVGAGFIGGAWPDHTLSGTSPAQVSYFNGSISDVAYFDQALSSDTVAALYSAGQNSNPSLTSITRPSGNESGWTSYNTVTGRVRFHSDENGGVWRLADQDSVVGSSEVYESAVLGAKPADYYRLGEAAAADAVNEVQGPTGGYSAVNLGQSGRFADASAAGFDGAASYLELPTTDVPTTGPASVEMWFNMDSGSTAGGVLFGYQVAPMTDIAAAGDFTPAVYVGVDGKLRGGLWTGSIAPITSTATVNDGQWHHVVLSADTTSQVLYLDGVQLGTLGGALVGTAASHAYVGAGKWSSSWPGAGAGAAGYFPGVISDVAYYHTALSAAQVSGHVQAANQSAPTALTITGGQTTTIAMPVRNVTVTTPTDETLTYSYDLVNGGRPVAQTDGLGNTTRFGYDVGGYTNLVYDPLGVWTQTWQDVRGNTIEQVTCQDQENNACSSVFYTYYPDATTTNLTPDARNDVLLSMRDARSASATDDTYLTSYGYDAQGNRTTVTDPLGRIGTTGYTDGTSVAAYDTGYAPAGLPYQITTAGGATKTIDYYHNGDVAQVTDEIGLVTRFVYDGLGRTTMVTEISDSYPSGQATSYTYDAMGRVLTQTDPPVTNRVTGAVHTAVTTSVYDDDGLVTSRTIADATGGDASRQESTTYNQFGQPATATDALGASTQFWYDAYGNQVKEVDEDGGETDSVYDSAGHLLTSTFKNYTGDPNNPSAPADLIVTSNAYDPAGRLASTTDAMGWQTLYTYTDNGLTATVTRKDPSTSATFVLAENTYDAAGNLVGRVTNDGATTTTFTVDAAGRTISSTLDPGGLDRTTSLAFSADDDLVSTTLSDTGGVLSRSDQRFDAAGNLTASVVHHAGVAPSARWRLDDGAGTTAADSSGVRNPGTVTGGVTWSSAHGGSAVFAGSGSKITTGAPVVDTSSSFTVSAWVSLADKNSVYKALGAAGAVQNSFDLRYQQSTDSWSFSMAQGDVTDAARASASSTSTPVANTWTHLVGVFDSSTHTMTLYVNGTAEGSASSPAAFTAQNAMTIGCGRWNGNDGNYWSGSISDVQLYARALSASEVSGVYGGTLPAAGAGVLATTATLDQRGVATSVTDANANTTDYENDEAGRPTVTVSPAVDAETGGAAPIVTRPVSYTGYDTFGEVSETKDPNGNVTVTAFNAEGQVLTTTLPSYTPPGSATPIVPVTTNTYDSVGKLVSTTNQLGKTTSYVFDQLGNLAKVTMPNTGVTTMTYDALGDRLSTTDATGAVTSATYDYLGRVLSTTDVVRQASASYTTTYAYGGGGWLSSTTSPDGVVSSATYNAAGETTSRTDGAGNTTTYTYDGAGRQVRVTAPDTTYTTTSYDLAGRATTLETYDGVSGTPLTTVTRGYDANGNVVASTDARGTTTTFGYDATDMLTTQVEPISGSDAITTSFGYDVAGNQTRFTDGRGNAFIKTYNAWNLPESLIEPATTAYPDAADRTFTTSYDGAGQPVTQALPGGVSTAYTYDDVGNVVGQAGSGAEAATVARSFGYDLAGRLTSATGSAGADSFTYDDRGLLLTASGVSGSSSFDYSADARMTSRVDAAGTTSYTYDGAGRLASATNTGTGIAVALTYNAVSLPSTLTYGTLGDTRSFGYDASHRLVSDEVKTPGGASVAKITYGWDANGNETSKTTTGFTAAATNTYTYDLADRLTSWDDGSTVTAYAYDKSGNRVQAGATTFSYDARNQLVSADSGASSLVYSARGTLLSKTTAGVGTLSTTSDAFGKVVSQAAAGGTQNYTYDGLGRVIQPGLAYSGMGNDLASDASASYTRDPDGQVLGAAAGASQKYVWTDLHTDVVGQFTSIDTSLSASAAYDPLGRVLASVGLVGQLGYQSEWTDTVTGRVNMLARWYDPQTGQFDTRDTASVSPTPNSVAANRFAYGDANPLTVTDPTGHWGWRSLNPVNAVKSVAKAAVSTVRSVASYAKSAASTVSGYVSTAARKMMAAAKTAVNAAKNVVKKALKTATNVVKKVVEVTKKITKVAKSTKTKVAKKVNTARKFEAKETSETEEKTKGAVKVMKQAGKATMARAARPMATMPMAVKDVKSSNYCLTWEEIVCDVVHELLGDDEIARIKARLEAGLGIVLIVAGFITMGTGIGSISGGALACATGAGCPVGAAVSVSGAIEAAVGAAAVSVGVAVLIDGIQRMNSSGSGGPSWSPETGGKLPKNWGSGTPNKKGVGNRWQDPNNRGNGVRIDQGDPNSPFPSQQVDHVIVRYNGKVIGRDGKPIKGSINDDPTNAHIPLSEWLKWSSWNKP